MTAEVSAWLELDAVELEGFLQRVKAILAPGDFALVQGMADALRGFARTLQSARTSIKGLREMVFGAKTEKASTVLKDGKKSETGFAPDGKPTVKAKRKGHGRRGHDDYTGAKRCRVAHETFKAGDRCPCCGKGTLYEMKVPGIWVLVRGQAPFAAEVWEQMRLRCSSCTEVFTAKLPEGSGKAKYDPTAGSMLSLMKYGSGFPLYRVDKLQKDFGVPFPPATQWEILAKLVLVVRPVFLALIRIAAQGKVLYIDDTVMRILEISKELTQRKLLPAPEAEEGNEDEAEKAKERTGIFTSAVVSEVEGHRIALFFTGTKHAGENLAAVLSQREKDLAPPIEMSDGLDRNVPKDFAVVLANCLTHGRRGFVKVVEDFPPECEFVIECLKGVYEIDAEAKVWGLSKEERLFLHQEKSSPIMEALEAWLEWKIEGKVIEPNSGLGKAIKYMRKRWQPLTLFLRVAGAPLDNNVAERVLKMAILHRKNSYFYKTRNGARVGDILMTLINTCRLERVNPFEYLTELQRNAEGVTTSPADWLPWNYRSTLAGLRGEARAG
jgi:transposase